MKLRNLLTILFLPIICLTKSYSQTDSLKATNAVFHQFTLNNKPISAHEAYTLLKGNAECQKHLNTMNTLKVSGLFALGVGVTSLGNVMYSIITEESKNSSDIDYSQYLIDPVTLAFIGVGCSIIGIVFLNEQNKLLQKALNIYNSKSTTSSFKPCLKFAVCSNGVGFQLNF